MSLLTLLMAAIFYLGSSSSGYAQPIPSTSTSGEKRIALVIGNSAYSESPLRNPGNDAVDMAQALRGLGFQVILRVNANRRQMIESVREFGSRIKQGGVGFFYYAGHGVQSRGKNFLIPVGASLQSESDLEFESMDANMVLAQMDEAGNRVNIVVLDACRDNPFARSFRSSSRGLAQMDSAKGTFLAYATSPGSVAADGEGRNGVYTKHLLTSLRQTDSKLEEVFKRVRVEVAKETGNRQIPWDASSLLGDFYFRLSSSSLQAPSSAATSTNFPLSDQAFWNSIKDLNNPDELKRYVDQFPNGTFVLVARARIAELQTQSPSIPVTAAKADPSLSTTDVAKGPVTTLPPGSTYTDCADCPEMVVIPAGIFVMGSPVTEAQRYDNEGEQRQVKLSTPFALGRTEVTRRQFSQFVQETGYKTGAGCYSWDGKWNNDASKSWRSPGFVQSDSDPVVCINWHDAKAYTDWISHKTGKRYRLPTETEWEYAARSGTTTAYAFGERITSQQANFTSASRGRTSPVASYTQNAFGLFDMHGNAAEWTEDCWNTDSKMAPADGRPRITGDCSRRVLRGGAWNDIPRNFRSASRNSDLPEYRYSNLGFRLAASSY